MLFLTGISQLAAAMAAAVLKPRYFRKSLRGVLASNKLSRLLLQADPQQIHPVGFFIGFSLLFSSPKDCQYFFVLHICSCRLKLGSGSECRISGNVLLLIVTFHTFSTADLFYSHAVHLFILQVLMEFLVDAVELIISELNFSFPVTVDTPAHAQIGKLVYFTHFLDLPMTGLAGLLAYR